MASELHVCLETSRRIRLREHSGNTSGLPALGTGSPTFVLCTPKTKGNGSSPIQREPSVANLDPRPSASAAIITSYRIKWRETGKPGFQADSFGPDRLQQAQRFKLDVELAGNRWPDGWIKGFGYRSDILEDPTVVDQPFLAFAMQFVRDKTGIQPDTRQRYARQVDVMAKELGGQVAADLTISATEATVQNVTDRHISRWINARFKAGSYPKTIANWHGLLYEVMQGAVEEGLRSTNPCVKTGKRLPRRDSFRTDDEMVFLTEPEVRLIATAMWPGLPDRDQDNRIVAAGRAEDRDLVLAGVGTGVRWGELTAFYPSDFTLKSARPAVQVHRAWKKNATGEFAKEDAGAYYLGPPKTRAGRRTIRIGAEVVAVLKRSVHGLGPKELVFTATRGGMVAQPYFYEYRWQRAIALAQQHGLAKTPRFYDLRHTYAAWLISAGVPLPEIQRRLGHKSIQTTVDVYGGLLDYAGDFADTVIDAAIQRCDVPWRDDDSLEGSPA